jgi:hypothetical protein
MTNLSPEDGKQIKRKSASGIDDDKSKIAK